MNIKNNTNIHNNDDKSDTFIKIFSKYRPSENVLINGNCGL